MDELGKARILNNIIYMIGTAENPEQIIAAQKLLEQARRDFGLAPANEDDNHPLSLKKAGQFSGTVLLSQLRLIQSLKPKKRKALRNYHFWLLIRLGVPIDAATKAITGKESDEWGHRLIERIEKQGKAAILPDKRALNGKEPLYSRPEIVAAIAETIKGEPPEGHRWKGKHIQAFMEANFGFQGVPIQRAVENLRRAEKINRKNAG